MVVAAICVVLCHTILATGLKQCRGQRAAGESSFERGGCVCRGDFTHHDIIPLTLEHDFLTGGDLQCIPQVFWDDDLPFRANGVSHTVKYNSHTREYNLVCALLALAR